MGSETGATSGSHPSCGLLSNCREVVRVTRGHNRSQRVTTFQSHGRSQQNIVGENSKKKIKTTKYFENGTFLVIYARKLTSAAEYQSLLINQVKMNLS